MFTIRVFGMGLIYLLLACSSARKNISQDRVKAERLPLAGKELADKKILFLTLGITLTDSVQDTYKFDLHNTVFAEGRIPRNPSEAELAPEPYNLYCELSDENKKRIELITVKNPLLSLIEYSPEPGKLEKKLFIQQKGEIFLRFQFSKSIKYLTIYKPHSDLRTLKKIYHAQI